MTKTKKKRYLKQDEIDKIVELLLRNGEDYANSYSKLASDVVKISPHGGLNAWLEEYKRDINVVGSVLNADLTIDEAVFRLLILKQNEEFKSVIDGFIKEIYSLK